MRAQLVARTKVSDQDRTWSGTAILISDDLALTCHHCLGTATREGSEIELLFAAWNTKPVKAKVLETDPELDVAVLRLPAPPPAQLKLKIPRLGLRVPNGRTWKSRAFPHPTGDDGIQLDGKIADNFGLRYGRAMIELDCEQAEDDIGGSSGGPVWVDGYVVGVLSEQFRAKAAGKNVNVYKKAFAVPMRPVVKRFPVLEDLVGWQLPRWLLAALIAAAVAVSAAAVTWHLWPSPDVVDVELHGEDVVDGWTIMISEGRPALWPVEKAAEIIDVSSGNARSVDGEPCNVREEMQRLLDGEPTDQKFFSVGKPMSFLVDHDDVSFSDWLGRPIDVDGLASDDRRTLVAGVAAVVTPTEEYTRCAQATGFGVYQWPDALLIGAVSVFDIDVVKVESATQLRVDLSTRRIRRFQHADARCRWLPALLRASRQHEDPAAAVDQAAPFTTLAVRLRAQTEL
jgi:hypothetical protein